MTIYVEQHGRTAGPFTLEKLNAMLARGELSASAMACAGGSSDWIPLSQVPGVNLTESQPGDASTTQGTNTVQQSSPSPRPTGRSSDDTRASDFDPQDRFFQQVTEAFQTATGYLMQPFELLDRTVQEKKPVDVANFFRLFLVHAEKFTGDCATAFATVLRQSTQVDAVRATTVKQLAKEIRSEAFEEADAALVRYHRTIACLMGGAEAAIEQANAAGAPLSPVGGALLGGLAAGRGSRVAGAAVGGLTALAGAMNTFNQQLALHGQALELIEQAERAAPAQVAEYFDAMVKTPGALIDLLGARCFGGAVDIQTQQRCCQTCVDHAKGLKLRAARSVGTMYGHVEQLAAAAEAEEARQARAQQEEEKAKLNTRRCIRLAVSFAIAMVIRTLQLYGNFSPGEFILPVMLMTALGYAFLAARGR